MSENNWHEIASQNEVFIYIKVFKLASITVIIHKFKNFYIRRSLQLS